MRELLRLVATPLALLLVGYPLTLSTDGRVQALCLVALGACVNALVLWSDGAVTLAAAALAGAYVAGLVIGDVGLDPLVPLYAAGLLVLVDLCDAGLGVPPERPVDRHLLRAVSRSAARCVLVAVAAGSLVLAGAALGAGNNLVLRTAAMAGVAVAVAVPVLAAGRAERSGRGDPHRQPRT